jgi:leader peptidase (prepilin peptidase) / N-methyltransferase
MGAGGKDSGRSAFGQRKQRAGTTPSKSRQKPRQIALSFDSTRPEVLAALFFVVGAIAGGLANLWAIALTPSRAPATALNDNQVRSSPWYQLLPIAGCFFSLGKNRFRGVFIGWRGLAVDIATGVLFAAYGLAAVRMQCQQVAEVRPDDFWKSARVVSHLLLITLLVAATVTDLRDYVIPDSITVPGTIFGLAAAVISGQLQMEHVWVDWNQEVPGITGPYIPGWLDAHRHWHGFAWSLAGGLVGAGLCAFVRGVSGLILRREALGLGDVTLLAMIGTFIGWQPTVFVFVLAPLCGLVCTVPLRLVSRKAYLPYGPFLAAATIVVLFSWRWLWPATRLVFGHPLSLALLSGGAALALTILLVILRVYHARFGEPMHDEGSLAD